MDQLEKKKYFNAGRKLSEALHNLVDFWLDYSNGDIQSYSLAKKLNEKGEPMTTIEHLKKCNVAMIKFGLSLFKSNYEKFYELKNEFINISIENEVHNVERVYHWVKEDIMKEKRQEYKDALNTLFEKYPEYKDFFLK